MDEELFQREFECVPVVTVSEEFPHKGCRICFPATWERDLPPENRCFSPKKMGVSVNIK